ncbi:MAG: wax ester/triacylglycerol synthase domain-containing protein [Conexibacter sp.]
MPHTFVLGHRLNRLDAVHYYLGEHPNANVAMCMVAMLDRNVAPETMRDGFAAAAEEIPRFKERLRTVPGDLTPPVWELDPLFDARRQFSTIAFPAEALWPEVLDRVDEFQSEPFVPDSPPWSVRYMTSTPGGTSVVVLKLHHALSDGTALALMLSKVFMREALGSAADDVSVVSSGAAAGVMRESVGHYRRALRDSLAAVARSVSRAARRRSELQFHVTELREYASGPSRWVVADHAPARRSAFFRVPLEVWRAVAQERGGGVNELYVAVAAATLRRYLVERGIYDGEPLAVVMPIDIRSEQQQQDGGNVTGAGILRLTGSESELSDLSGIAHQSRAARDASEDPSASVTDGLLALCPGRLQRRALFRRFSTKDALATNVIVPLRCGVGEGRAEMVHILPPVIGTPVSFALTGYDDAVHLAVNMDLGLIDDPGTLERALADILQMLFGTDAVNSITRLG